VVDGRSVAAGGGGGARVTWHQECDGGGGGGVGGGGLAAEALGCPESLPTLPHFSLPHFPPSHAHTPTPERRVLTVN
jgi:hypothetical protein